MAKLETPIVCLVIGEGGSGGALGIGIGDRILMLENAYYSVISPEGCATILWRSVEHADKAARILKLTAPDLARFGIIDEMIKEPPGGAHSDHLGTVRQVRDTILRHIKELQQLSPKELIAGRYERHRRIGVFHEEQSEALEQATDSAVTAEASDPGANGASAS